MRLSEHFDKRLIKNIDWPLLIVTFIISAIGIVAVAAATNSFQEGMSRSVKMQLFSFVLGIIIIIAVLAIDYSYYLEWHIIIYGISILCLLAVLLVGKSAYGAKSWIAIGPFQFQPSEIAKIAVILTLAKHLSEKRDDINTFKDLIPGALIAGIPLMLIMLQPDMGTAIVIVFIVFIMYFAAGINYKLLLKIMVPVLLVAPPIFWFFILDPYQKNRILVFLNPELDPRGDGYNVLQSIISVGSGKLKGYGITSKATTDYVKFIPVKESDFIFSVIGRGLGFIGCIALVLLFLFLMIRCIHIAQNAKDDFGMLICAGVTAMFAFHILENIGMSIGIMPVTGIPLPFVSYGGTSLMINMLSLGLILNVYMRRQLILF